MNRKEKTILAVLAIVLIAAVTAVTAMSMSAGRSETQGGFTPPPFELHAMTGTPETIDIDKEAHYETLELPVPEGKCTVALEASPRIENNELEIFFTVSSDTTTWVRIVFYDGDCMIGKTGLLRPGEYVKAVTLEKAVESGDALKMKILTYEPDTYYSLGTATAELIVR